MIYNLDIAGQIADFLLEIKAVILRPESPFRWASGWNSPIYCDNRIILSYPEVRTFVADQFAEVIRNKFSDSEVVAGVATAGIAHAALAADRLNMSMAYVRPKPKDHGTGKLIEGRIEPGQKTIVIEDLISTGKSSLQAVEGIRAEGATVIGLLAVFSYGFPEAENAFNEENVPFYSLSNYDILLERALLKRVIKEADLALLAEWRKDPAVWGK